MKMNEHVILMLESVNSFASLHVHQDNWKIDTFNCISLLYSILKLLLLIISLSWMSENNTPHDFVSNDILNCCKLLFRRHLYYLKWGQ